MFHSQLNGDDLHSPSREWIENTLGVTLPQLQCVTYNGYGTNFPTVKVSNPVIEVVHGIVTSDIATGKIGQICVMGWIQRVNTSAWPVGTKLYCGSDGMVSSTLAGLPIAVVVKSHATTGLLYVDCQTLTTSDITGAITQYGWSLDGNNSGIHPNPRLGTTNLASFPIISDNIQRMFISETGPIAIGDHQPITGLHLKFHPEHPQSGKIFDTFALTINDTAPINGYEFTMPVNSIATFTVTANARKADGSAKATIKKTATFYRDSGDVEQQLATQTDYMNRTLPFALQILPSATKVVCQIASPDSDETTWHGTIELDLFTEGA